MATLFISGKISKALRTKLGDIKFGNGIWFKSFPTKRDAIAFIADLSTIKGAVVAGIHSVDLGGASIYIGDGRKIYLGDGRKTNGGKGRGGPRSRQQLGLEPVRNTTVQVEDSVIQACRDRHGSLANALRYAAKHPKNKAG